MRSARLSSASGVCPESGHSTAATTERGTIVLVGSPNVGKSVLWNNLTGAYVTVSNYPGTTVEIARGICQVGGFRYEVIDSPGMYSMIPLSEEERVARNILIEARPEVVLHVINASNIERMLLLTFQLIEAGLPLIVVLNMMDEAEAQGLQFDVPALERELGVPVVATVSTTGEGLDELRRRIAEGKLDAPVGRFRYAPSHGLCPEESVAHIEALLPDDFGVSRRCIALLLLQNDEEINQVVRRRAPEHYDAIRDILDEARERTGKPVDYVLTLQRRSWAGEMRARTVAHTDAERPFAEKLSRLMTHPLTGLPIVLAILYFGFYRFVGVFGAGTVVDFIEGTIFEGYVNPVVQGAVERVVPWAALQDLIAGEYGVITLGVRYAVALILPIVTFFFLLFSFIEDVGYLPRLALLLDRLLKKVGLSGRAVIPMVLGFGCDTMATMVTRTLSTRRERTIAILLLSVAVPCSAQLGVIMAMLSGVPWALLIWAVVIGGVYLLTGSIAAWLIPGRPAPFYVEIPPLRWPKLSNILTKTYARVKWYFREVLPLFLVASVLIWFGRLTGVFQVVIGWLEHPTRWIGLPPEAAKAFLFGFFRRDYGVAGLYDLNEEGLLTGGQLVVAAVALTLFLPCIAQVMMTVKEKGWKRSIAVLFCALGVSFTIAFGLSRLLPALGITLEAIQ